jgi:predicted CXXCH cytochrome family protein
MKLSRSGLIFVSVMIVAGTFSTAAIIKHPARGQALDSGQALATSPPAFVTSRNCKACHQGEYRAWKKSHHSWALRPPTPENVLGNFDDATFEHHGVRSRFFKRGEKYFIETDFTGDKNQEFEIKYTVGVEPLQQYLVELDKGRLQALDVAWDTNAKLWFNLYPTEKIKVGDGLHWSGPYKNWQGRCAECHQTNFKKNYSPKTESYQSKWSELTIGCEACHGPGSTHIRWAKNPSTFRSKKPAGVDAKGLTAALPRKHANAEIQLCARCHSRRSPLGANSPPPGSKFADHYRLSLLREGLYHADGQIDDEVYVYGSFLQSKMYKRGVRCSNCHEPHSGALVANGNAVCTQCHNTSGNAAFENLKKSNYDSASHHHHEAGSKATQCVSCHMPAKTYMQVDPRRDHSFRVPRPDLSAKLSTPNACSGCHAEKTASWAASKVKEWFPNGRSGTAHHGEVIHAGRTRTGAETAKELIDLASDEEKPAIVRASALDLLRRSMTPEWIGRISPFLKAEDSLIREAALRLLDRVPAPRRIELVASLLHDPAKSVRLEAARLMIGIPLEGLSGKDKAAARREIGAYQRSVFSRADYPETQMQIAGLAMVLKEFGTAQTALRAALSMDPQLADAWLTLARIQAALRQPERTRKTLERAAEKLPENGEIQFQLGAVYSSARDHVRAIAALEKSLNLAGASPVLLDLLAANHIASGNLTAARAHANDLRSKYPEHRPSPPVRQLLRLPK